MKIPVICLLSTVFQVGFSLAVQSAEIEPDVLEQVVAVEGPCAWPNLTLMPDGTIIAVFHNGDTHGSREADLDCYATRDGLVWEKRSTVTRHEPDTVRMNHAAGVAKNGDLVVLCSGWTNVKQPQRPKQAPFRDDILRTWVLRSSDGGRSWEKREGFPAPEDGWTEHIPFGDIWIGEDGALHASTYQGEYKDPATTARTKAWRSWHFRSDDDGWTWKAVSIIGPAHNETDIFPLGGGKWLAAGRRRGVDLFRSDDKGQTWSKPQTVTEPNELNGHLMRLKDGRLLLTYGVRIDGRRGVCAKLSDDEGKTWGGVLRISRAADGADCGYPSSVQLKDGNITTAWYARRIPQYVLGVTVWKVPTTGKVAIGQPVWKVDFRHEGIDRLFGR